MAVAIVTGADSGIGKATAVLLAERGFDIGITWHSDEAGAEGTAVEVRQRGRRAELAQADFGDTGEPAEIVSRLADTLGGVDVLVNNAGTAAGAPFLDLELGEWEQVLRVDLTAPFLAGQEAARRMISAGGGGRIINVTSVHEHVPLTGASAYCAAKG